MSAFWIVIVSVSVLALLVNTMLVITAFENRRYAKVHEQCRDENLKTRNQHVDLFIPCAGNEPGLYDRLTRFLGQSYGNYTVTFIIGSPDDTALPVIEAAISECEVSARIKLVNPSQMLGKKVNKLREATKELRHDTTILAFADSDVVPEPDWLTKLVASLEKHPICITGYRWIFPEKNKLPNLVVSSLNAVIAGYLGRHRTSLVWGGTWAIYRAAFEELKVRDAWQYAVSDDLIASKVIQRANRSIYYDPSCLVRTNFDGSWASSFEFMRRQLLIFRKHFPGYWWGGFLTTALSQLTFWSLLGAGLAYSMQGNRNGPLMLVMALGIYVMAIARAALRQAIAASRFPNYRHECKAAYWFDILGFPITGLIGMLVFVISSLVNRITWRGTHYTFSTSRYDMNRSPSYANNEASILPINSFEPEVVPIVNTGQTWLLDRLSRDPRSRVAVDICNAPTRRTAA
ncbi:MAG TPA: glycosyltransferase family 2 protein [Pirellulaceae bacterium]|nr:glycosyltransferase family 2 protein [Pirellulaceae bacterium]HMO93218.1 glycosyltransferase family 2 protein [Pirellulaceae bacterium]HMP70049.1 glycosyltransferase family 2 protein [Pirellulaceae bacterium]